LDLPLLIAKMFRYFLIRKKREAMNGDYKKMI